MKRILQGTLFCIIIPVLLQSCGNEPKDCFEAMGFDSFDTKLNSRVEEYHDSTSTEHVNYQPKGKIKAYIDFSNGLVQAYTSNEENASILEKITQNLTGKAEWLRLGNDSIVPLDYTSTELFNKVTNAKMYNDIMAPIERALGDITKSSNDALLVTDFEEYTPDRKEQFENFAKGYFIDWVKKGNSIDFFITNYKEITKDRRTVDKHLYFIVFNYGKEKKLLGDINYALKDRGFKYDTFSLNNDFYKLTNEYGGEKSGGNYYDKNGKDDASKNVLTLKTDNYINGLKKGKNFEFYEFELTWKFIYETLKNTPDFTDFFRNLYIDASKDDVFQLKNLDVKVYDVTDDFVHYSKCNEVKNHQPKITKDANGNPIFDPTEEDNIAIDCYLPSLQNGTIKEDWIFKQKEPTALKEVFTLNTELYNNGFKDNKDKIEIGIKFHPNFNGSQITNPNALLKVDVLISDCEPNFERLNSLFVWQSTTDPLKKNDALAEAIRNTLLEINPKEKIIYTYYIKTLSE